MAKLIGNEPNQVPTNGDLGKLAFQEPEAVNITGGTLDSVTVTNLTTDGASLDGAVVINEAGADVDFRIESDTNANAFFVDGATGNVGVGTSSPNGKLNIVGSYHQQLILQNTTADSAVKGATFNGAHYTNSEEPLLLGATYSNSTENVCYYGGGWSAANTATSLQFYTAANNTTTTGTERMRITSSGNVGIGTTSPAQKLDVNGSIKATQGLGTTIYVGNISQNTTASISYPYNSLSLIAAEGNNAALFLTKPTGGSIGCRGVYSTGSDIVFGLTSEPAGGTYLRIWYDPSGTTLYIKNVNSYTGPYKIVTLSTF